jgi:hypothetical protein
MSKCGSTTIICLEQSADDNGFLTRSAKAYKNEIRVSSVLHMVEKVLQKSNGCKINKLYLLGHGCPGDQSVGSGTGFDASGEKCLALRKDAFQLRGDAEEHLSRLKGKFAAKGTIVLGGCYVAEGEKGKGLLMRISTLLDNVAVCASESLQKPWPGIEGIVVRCVGKTRNIVHTGHEYSREDTQVVEPAWTA